MLGRHRTFSDCSPAVALQGLRGSGTAVKQAVLAGALRALRLFPCSCTAGRAGVQLPLNTRGQKGRSPRRRDAGSRQAGRTAPSSGRDYVSLAALRMLRKELGLLFSQGWGWGVGLTIPALPSNRRCWRAGYAQAPVDSAASMWMCPSHCQETVVYLQGTLNH